MTSPLEANKKTIEESLEIALRQAGLVKSAKYIVSRRGKNRHQRRMEASSEKKKSGLSTAGKAFKQRQARKNKRRQARRKK